VGRFAKRTARRHRSTFRQSSAPKGRPIGTRAGTDPRTAARTRARRVGCGPPPPFVTNSRRSVYRAVQVSMLACPASAWAARGCAPVAPSQHTKDVRSAWKSTTRPSGSGVTIRAALKSARTVRCVGSRRPGTMGAVDATPAILSDRLRRRDARNGGGARAAVQRPQEVRRGGESDPRRRILEKRHKGVQRGGHGPPRPSPSRQPTTRHGGSGTRR